MDDNTYDIKALDKARVLKALVNGTRVLGLGALQARDKDMTVEDAGKVLFGDDRDPGGSEASARRGRSLYVDYVWGKPIKVDMSGDTIDLRLYDRDAGSGKGKRVLDAEFGRDVAKAG